MKKNHILFFLCIALAACASGENDENRPIEIPTEFDRETFNRERQLWLEQDIQNYSFRQRCGDPGALRAPTVVYVQNGAAIFSCGKDFSGNECIYYPDSTTGAFFAGYALILSISDLYTEIERWLNNGDSAIRIYAEYDSVSHYPTYVWNGKRIAGTANYRDFRTVFISNLVLDPEYPE